MLLFAIEVLLFPLAGCFFFVWLFMHSFRLFFFGAPYNGVYKFSAVFLSRCGTGNKSLLFADRSWRVRPFPPAVWPAETTWTAQLRQASAFKFNYLFLVLSGEIPNYIIKFICVRLMLRVFCLFLYSAINYIKLYFLCSCLLVLYFIDVVTVGYIIIGNASWYDSKLVFTWAIHDFLFY